MRRASTTRSRCIQSVGFGYCVAASRITTRTRMLVIPIPSRDIDDENAKNVPGLGLACVEMDAKWVRDSSRAVCPYGQTCLHGGRDVGTVGGGVSDCERDDPARFNGAKLLARPGDSCLRSGRLADVPRRAGERATPSPAELRTEQSHAIRRTIAFRTDRRGEHGGRDGASIRPWPADR